MRTRTIVIIACFVVAFAKVAFTQEDVALRPGSAVPHLTVDQWVTTGGLPSKSLGGNSKGTIHVIEFWSSTSDEAVPSFMHMASLKKQYESQSLRLTLVSHETVEELRKFLSGSVRTADNQLISCQQLAAEIAVGSAPSRSVHSDYLGKENLGQIPWAFLVGRDGTLEWHGHPSEMDHVLDALVNGKWDRDKIEREQRLMAEIQMTMAKLTKTKDWKNALLEIERFESLTNDPRIRFGLLKSKLEIFARTGHESNEIDIVLQQLFAICVDEPLFAHDVANSVYQLAIRGIIKKESSIQLAVTGLNKAIEQVDNGSTKSGMLHTLAKMEGLLGRTQQAIEHQKKAIELAQESQKPALTAFLAKLTSQATVPR